MLTPQARCHVDHGWLPLLIPAGAKRFRVGEGAYRETFKDAGAQLVDEGADVELGPVESLEAKAPFVTVPLDADLPEGGSRPERVARRVAGNLGLRATAATAARDLRRRGLRARVLTWDVDRTFLDRDGGDIRRQRLRDRVHRYAVVVGANAPVGETILDAVHREAGEPRTKAPLVARVVVSSSETGVFRIAVGPARRQIESQIAALEELRATEPPPEIAGLVPWVTREGRTGIGRWSREQRLSGSPASFPLPARLLDDAVRFLADLYLLGGREPSGRTVSDDAERVAAVRPQLAEALLRLGAEADEALAGVPRGFSHGDFWSGNLLQEDGKLTGVVDWDSAGAGRLPVLDLMHLSLNAHERLRPEAWGAAVTERLLPAVRSGEDPLLARYLDATGLELETATLEALVVAYWLDRVAYQVDLYDDIATSELWLSCNVDDVLRALVPWRMPTAPVTVERVPPDKVRDEWSRLAVESQNVFATPEWVETWARHEGSLELWAVREGERLAALLPLELWRSRPLRVLRFAGHGPSDRLGPACEPDDRAVALEGLRAVIEARDVDVALGEQFPADEGWSARLGASRLSAGGSPILRLAGRTWDELLAARSRNFREQVRRRERKLLAAHDVTYRLATPATIAGDFETLVTLHRRHWGSESTFLEHLPFHRAFATIAAERGWARLWLLEVEGRAVAAWYGLRFAGNECYYQAGRDPEWEHASVGFVLLVHSIRSALEDGASEYWFLRGGESYKYRFADADPGLETWGLARGRLSSTALSGAQLARRLRGR
jgi:CelD/BcsL family acetyltransferase involved in cellulose biosynthesis